MSAGGHCIDASQHSVATAYCRIASAPCCAHCLSPMSMCLGHDGRVDQGRQVRHIAQRGPLLQPEALQVKRLIQKDL